MQAVLVPVGDDRYAVSVEWVQQVVAAPLVTPLVTASAFVMGLFNLRGEIVPLFDTAALLGVGTIGSAAFAVILRGPDGPAALAATAVPTKTSLDPPASASSLPGTNGTFATDGHVIVLLDPGTLLGSERTSGSDRPATTLAGALK